jgi:hypothetical protein
MISSSVVGLQGRCRSIEVVLEFFYSILVTCRPGARMCLKYLQNHYVLPSRRKLTRFRARTVRIRDSLEEKIDANFLSSVKPWTARSF